MGQAPNYTIAVFQQTNSIPTPDAGMTYLYAKSDGQFYSKTADGREIMVNYTSLSSLTGNWQSVYSNVNTNSASWGNGSTDITGVWSNSANWQSNYSRVNSTSANWSSVYSNVNSNSAAWNNGGTDMTGVWSNSANWQSVYSNVNSNSASWGGGTTDITGVWSNSANWQSNYSRVNSTSANWSSVYSNVNSNSANNASNYSTVNVNSATWTAGYNQSLILMSQSSDWNIAYTQSNILASASANNASVYSRVNSTSANWSSVYSNVNSNSSNNASVYSTVNNTSANWNYAHNFALTGGVLSGNLTATRNISAESMDTNFIDFNLTTPAYQEGRSFYDNTDHVFAYYNDVSNLVIKPSRDTYLTGVNKTGGTLAKGTVVYLSGAQGNRPKMWPAIATTDNTSDTIAGVLANSTIADAEGYILSLGVLEGIDTSSWSAGELLYLSPYVSGGLTHTKPTAPYHNTMVGFPLNSTNNGKLAVRMSFGTEISELHDVAVINVADKNVLEYNSTSGIWINTTQYLGNDVRAITANWDSTQTTVNTNSANWNTAFTQSNILASASANNASNYSTVNSNSASWGGGTTDMTGVWSNSANWQSNYSNTNTNSASWSGSGGGSAIKSTITQNSHGLSAGNVIKFASGVYSKAQANTAANAEALGVIESVTVNTFDLVYSGAITGLSGLSAENIYFLSDTTPGLLTLTEPTSSTSVSKPMLFATSTTTGVVLQMRGFSAGTANTPIEYPFAVSNENTPLTVGTSKTTFRMPCAMTLTSVRASMTTAPVGSALIVDINHNGTTIMSTYKLSIDSGEKTSTTAVTAAVITTTALADDAEITVDIDQIGSLSAGTGLKCVFIGYRA